MFDRGHHREATLWIVMTHNLSNRVIQRDGGGEDRARSRAGLHRVLGELGLGTVGERHARQQLAQWVTEQVFGAADAAVARTSAVASSGAAPSRPWAPGRPRRPGVLRKPATS